jgi:hypothetical protein
MHRIPVISRRQAAALLLVLSAAAITACGGGGDSAGATGPMETPTAYASGPITGFGSVIVNGVRYDDSASSVIDDDDGGHSRDELKLGMMVEVDGHQMDRANGLGKALRIRFGSEIVGPLTYVSPDGGSLEVLGQTVLVTSTTVFDDMPAGGLPALFGTAIEVHAQFNVATGKYTATRIEPKADAKLYKLRGVVADLNPTAKTFTLGGEVISYNDIAAGDLPQNLANGLKVRVRLLKTQVSGQWVAVSVRHGVRKVEDRDEAHVRGSITVWTSETNFEVNGLKVDATTASFPDGKTGVVLGAEVEVEGSVVAGVLVATKVELDDERHAGDRHRFELHGLISALDTTVKTFSLRGVTVSYAGDVTFKDGTADNLANGAKVEVKGTPSADRTTLVASSIEFED